MQNRGIPGAILFDVDGTLAETEEAHRRAFNQAFQDFDLPWSWSSELYGRLLAVTGGKERISHFIAAYGANPVLDGATIADLHRHKTSLYEREVFEGGLVLRDGVERLIRSAADAGVQVGVATTTTKANVDALLTATLGPAWERMVPVVAAGDMVKAKKPAPDIYELALARLDCAGEEVVAIEDSRNGLLSAVGAGVRVLVTPSSYTAGEDFIQAVAVVDRLGDPGVPSRVLSGPPLLEDFVDLAYLGAVLGAGERGSAA